jgi:hypothetical protein
MAIVICLSGGGIVTVVTDRGEIYRSPDFGLTWLQEYSGMPSLRGASTFDDERVIAVGPCGIIKRTGPQ